MSCKVKGELCGVRSHLPASVEIQESHARMLPVKLRPLKFWGGAHEPNAKCLDLWDPSTDSTSRKASASRHLDTRSTQVILKNRPFHPYLHPVLLFPHQHSTTHYTMASLFSAAPLPAKAEYKLLRLTYPWLCALVSAFDVLSMRTVSVNKWTSMSSLRQTVLWSVAGCGGCGAKGRVRQGEMNTPLPTDPRLVPGIHTGQFMAIYNPASGSLG